MGGEPAIATRIPQSLFDEIHALAERSGKTPSAVLRDMVVMAMVDRRITDYEPFANRLIARQALARLRAHGVEAMLMGSRGQWYLLRLEKVDAC